MLPNLVHDESAEVARLLDNGNDELAQLFIRYDEDLKRMVRFRLSAPLQARVDESDVIQDGYLEAARLLPEYLESQDVPPSIWIRRMVRQSLSRHIRFHVNTEMRSTKRENENRWLLSAESSSMVFDIADSISSPHSRVANQEMFASIWKLLDSLDPVEREILCLKQLENLTFQQVADELSMDVSAVKRRFQRAVLELGKRAAHLA